MIVYPKQNNYDVLFVAVNLSQGSFNGSSFTAKHFLETVN